jgi:hypothetical protein
MDYYKKFDNEILIKSNAISWPFGVGKLYFLSVFWLFFVVLVAICFICILSTQLKFDNWNITVS